MTDFTLSPGATEGAKMPDGTVYRPNQRGKITVDNKKHIAQLRSPNSAKNLGLMHESIVPIGEGFADRYCECFFNNFPWAKNCGRCGKLLTDKQEAK